jgi:transcriptional regulator with XRE-family HTH domain
MSLGTTLRRARIDAGLTQRELAVRAGTSQATVSAYESGRKQPSLATAQRLLDHAGVELRPVTRPGRRTRAQLERAGRHLEEALALAQELPFRRARTIDYPRLPEGP